MRWKRGLVVLGSVLVLLVGLAWAVGYLATMEVVGHFAPLLRAQPADYGVRAEVISFRSLDGLELKGWWIPAQTASSAVSNTAHGTVVLAHGNGGNRSSMVSRAAFLAQNGYNAFAIDLRAHGQSAGNYMTPGYLEALDILGAVETAKRRGEHGPFVAFGHSYGARASLWAAAQSKEVAAVVADGAFISIYGGLKRAVARAQSDPHASFAEKIGLRLANSLSQSSWAAGFVEWVYYRRTGVRMTPDYDDVMPAIRHVGTKPILFIVGEKDRTAPPEDAHRMYDTARSSMKKMLVVADADHNSTFSTDPELYKTTVLQFLVGALPPPENRKASLAR